MILDKYGVTSDEIRSDTNIKLDKLLQNFRSSFITRWDQSSRSWKFFELKYSSWLQEPVISQELGNEIVSSVSVKVKKSVGRPRADFDALSDRSCRRRTESIRDSYTTFELLNATEISLRTAHHNDQAKVLRAVSISSPETMKRLVDCVKGRTSSIRS